MIVKLLVMLDAVACGVAARRVGLQWWGETPPTRSRKAVMMTDADTCNGTKADAFQGRRRDKMDIYLRPVILNEVDEEKGDV